MTGRYDFAFQPINSTAPAFNSSAANSIALEATGREWQHPTSRAIAISAAAADDFTVILGSSDVVGSTVGGQLMLGGIERVLHVDPTMTHMGIASSTDVTVNITLGYGF